MLKLPLFPLWENAAIPAGLYTISCVKDETMVLDIAGQSCALRADLVINKKNGSASQTFLITPDNVADYGTDGWQ